jgi:hypothetical protein
MQLRKLHSVIGLSAFNVVDGVRSLQRSAIGCLLQSNHIREPSTCTIGLDIAKNVFQIHGIDSAEKVVVRKQLRRSQVLAFFKALPPSHVGAGGLVSRALA